MAGRFAYLFPGQGSQRVGMGADLYGSVPASRELYDRANTVLGYDLAGLCFEGPEEVLRQTIHTQPALYVTSCAALAALRERVSAEPFAAAGHSVGEYAALYAAGVVDFETGLRLVRRRAELMQEAADRRPGTMAAVLGIDSGASDTVRAACETARQEGAGVVSVANYNCPGQIVISGEQAAVDRAGELLREAGARRIVPLTVSGAFHSPLMVTAGDALYPALRTAQFGQARLPVVVNVTAEYNRTAADFAPYLTMQVSGSVRWEESMRLLLRDGVDTFVELGSGDVLAGLMKRIDRSARAFSVQDTDSLEAAVAALQELAQAQAAETAAQRGPAPAPPSPVIYHIARRDGWEAARTAGAFAPPSLAQEGFLHCSRPEQVHATANDLFRARHGLVLLSIAVDRLRCEVRYEGADNGQEYPHLYGPLNVDAVTSATDLEPGPDGRFRLALG